MRKYNWPRFSDMTVSKNVSTHSQTGLSEIQNFWLFVNLVSMVCW